MVLNTPLITLSKDITPCNDGKITSGWLTGVEVINAFASDTNKDGTSKKIAFKTDADTQQLGLYFLVKGTSTVKHELFFDNVLLSGNKFLQKPSDYLAAHSLSYVNTSSENVFLLQKDVNFIQEYTANPSTTGEPIYYAQFDVDNFIVAPTPNADLAVEWPHRPTILATCDGLLLAPG